MTGCPHPVVSRDERGRPYCERCGQMIDPDRPASEVLGR